jgi:hypothetical protein
MKSRVRLPEDQSLTSLSPLEMLEIYWRTKQGPPENVEELQKLAAEIISQSMQPAGSE